MHTVSEAFSLALALILTGGSDLYQIVGLSLQVSLGATLVACALGLPLGALVAIARFRGRNLLLIVMNALMGLPP
ncbi:MAG TPA: ABC transporter permease, partial [Citreicella sp.]|nr:ABC transporter permease [Citreicella sp.]